MPVQAPRATSAPGGLIDTSRSPQDLAETTGPWCTVVWNDPVNLMSYVVFVFRRYFGYSRPIAEQLSLIHI